MSHFPNRLGKFDKVFILYFSEYKGKNNSHQVKGMGKSSLHPDTIAKGKPKRSWVEKIKKDYSENLSDQNISDNFEQVEQPKSNFKFTSNLICDSSASTKTTSLLRTKCCDGQLFFEVFKERVNRFAQSRKQENYPRW
jgi:superfamily I DNA and/or RNA helicase